MYVNRTTFTNISWYLNCPPKGTAAQTVKCPVTLEIVWYIIHFHSCQWMAVLCDFSVFQSFLCHPCVYHSYQQTKGTVASVPDKGSQNDSLDGFMTFAMVMVIEKFVNGKKEREVILHHYAFRPTTWFFIKSTCADVGRLVVFFPYLFF